MAIKPSEINDVDAGLLGKFEQLIDEKMSNARWVKGNRYGSNTNPYWTIILPEELTDGEKKALINMYEQAGWALVVCQNSSETEVDRPGLCSVELHKMLPETA